jgi:hypothetical protein
MFQNVTVPNVPADIPIEPHNDPRHHPRLGANSVLPSSFGRIWWNRRAGESQFLPGEIAKCFEFLSIQNLKSYQMKMYGVRIIGWIDEAPNFR